MRSKLNSVGLCVGVLNSCVGAVEGLLEGLFEGLWVGEIVGLSLAPGPPPPSHGPHMVQKPPFPSWRQIPAPGQHSATGQSPMSHSPGGGAPALTVKPELGPICSTTSSSNRLIKRIFFGNIVSCFWISDVRLFAKFNGPNPQQR